MMKIQLSAMLLAIFMVNGWTLPAFPGAEGYGSETPGGRGGKVLFVTNTNSTGPGSFYEALRTAGPRIIIFRVSGVINLQPAAQWNFENVNWSYLTVAGQTSPGGITVIASGGSSPIFQYTNNQTHDLVWRFLRFRAQGQNEHAFEQYLGRDFILDHCEFSGGMDECLDIVRSHDFTIQWCINANSPLGGQNYGWLLAYNPLYNISYHHSILANHSGRCGPEAHTANEVPVNNGMMDYRNNICYNSGRMNMFALANLGGPFHINVVGNTFKSGPSTDESNVSSPASTVKPLYFASQVHIHESDDRMMHYKFNDTITGDLCDRRYGRAPVNYTAPFSTAPVTTQPAAQAYDLVLNKAGVFPRDSMSLRTLRNIRTRTGALGLVTDSLTRSGPLPPPDADMDGMPDCWETAMGFNPNDSAGKNGDHDGDGYTNIEEYINDLALQRVGDPVHNTGVSGACLESAEGPAPSVAHPLFLDVRPNPAGVSGSIHFRTNGVLSGIVEVADLTGRRVAALPLQDGHTVMRKGSLAAGIYLLRFQAGPSLSIQRKLIILR